MVFDKQISPFVFKRYLPFFVFNRLVVGNELVFKLFLRLPFPARHLVRYNPKCLVERASIIFKLRSKRTESLFILMVPLDAAKEDGRQ